MQNALEDLTRLSETHPQVGIVGGTHGTGAQFAELLAGRGFSVRVSGRNTEVNNAELAASSDLLVFAPPLKSCVQIIEDTVLHCQRDSQLIVDLCSLKEGPMQAMAGAKGRVIGLHPLFGPSFRDVSGQDMVICQAPDAAQDALYAALCRELREMGLVLHEMSAAQHDQLMATIQVIPHLGALVKGALFRKLGIDAAASLKICSPVYKTELYMIGRIHSQNPALYASIIGQNPHSPRIAQELSSIAKELALLIGDGEVEALQDAFLANQTHLGEFADHALAESQALLQRAYGNKKPGA